MICTGTHNSFSKSKTFYVSTEPSAGRGSLWRRRPNGVGNWKTDGAGRCGDSGKQVRATYRKRIHSNGTWAIVHLFPVRSSIDRSEQHPSGVVAKRVPALATSCLIVRDVSPVFRSSQNTPESDENNTPPPAVPREDPSPSGCQTPYIDDGGSVAARQPGSSSVGRLEHATTRCPRKQCGSNDCQRNSGGVRQSIICSDP